jgi:hypothetical protein
MIGQIRNLGSENMKIAAGNMRVSRVEHTSPLASRLSLRGRKLVQETALQAYLGNPSCRKERRG